MNNQNPSDAASFYWTPAEQRRVFEMLSRGTKPTSSSSPSLSPASASAPSSSNTSDEVSRRNRRKAVNPRDRKIVAEEYGLQNAARNSSGDQGHHQSEIQKDQNVQNKRRRLQEPRTAPESQRRLENPEPFNLQRLLIQEELQNSSVIPPSQRHQENPESVLQHKGNQQRHRLTQDRILNIPTPPISIQRHQRSQHLLETSEASRQSAKDARPLAYPGNYCDHSILQRLAIQLQLQNSSGQRRPHQNLIQKSPKSSTPIQRLQGSSKLPEVAEISRQPEPRHLENPEYPILRRLLTQDIPTSSIQTPRLQGPEAAQRRQPNSIFPSSLSSLFGHPNFPEFKNLLLFTCRQVGHQNPGKSPEDVLKIVVNHNSDLKKHCLFPLWHRGSTTRNRMEMEQHQLETLILECHEAARDSGASGDVRSGRRDYGVAEEVTVASEDRSDSGVRKEAIVGAEDLQGAVGNSEDVRNGREDTGTGEGAIMTPGDHSEDVEDSGDVRDGREDPEQGEEAVVASEGFPEGVGNSGDVGNLTENHQEGRNEEEVAQTLGDVPEPLHAPEHSPEDASEGVEELPEAVGHSEDVEGVAKVSAEDVSEPLNDSEDLEILEESEDGQGTAENSEDHPRPFTNLETVSEDVEHSEASQEVSEDVEECPKEKEDSPEIIFLKETPGSIQNSDDVLEITITYECHRKTTRRPKISGFRCATMDILKDPRIQKAILDVIGKNEAIWKKRDFLDFDEDWETVGMEVYQMTGGILSVPQLRLFWKSAATSFSRFLRELICVPKPIPDPKTVENILNSSDLYHHLKFYRRHLSNYERELWNEVRGDFVDTKILQNIEMCMVNLKDYDLADIKDLDVGDLVDFSTKVCIDLD